MDIVITTKSGSVYRIDKESHHWLKLKGGRILDGPNALWGLMQSNDTFGVDNDPYPLAPGQTAWDNLNLSAGELPSVGRHLFIQGKDSWWVTTPIASVVVE